MTQLQLRKERVAAGELRLTAEDFAVEIIAGDQGARVVLPPAEAVGRAVFVVKGGCLADDASPKHSDQEAGDGRGPVEVFAAAGDHVEDWPGVSLQRQRQGVMLVVEARHAWRVLAGEVLFLGSDDAASAVIAGTDAGGTFERSRLLNPQGVIDALLAQTSRQAAEIKRLNDLLSQPADKSKGPTERNALF